MTPGVEDKVKVQVGCTEEGAGLLLGPQQMTGAEKGDRRDIPGSWGRAWQGEQPTQRWADTQVGDMLGDLSTGVCWQMFKIWLSDINK